MFVQLVVTTTIVVIAIHFIQSKLSPQLRVTLQSTLKGRKKNTKCKNIKIKLSHLKKYFD